MTKRKTNAGMYIHCILYFIFYFFTILHLNLCCNTIKHLYFIVAPEHISEVTLCSKLSNPKNAEKTMPFLKFKN